MTSRSLSRFGLTLLFVGAGVAHLLAPGPYLAIMPPRLPWPATLVAASGLAEIAGGLGACFRLTRRPAGWGLIALLIAVSPANVEATFTGIEIGTYKVPAWLLWARLPLQLLFIVWVYQACLRQECEKPAVR